MDGPKRVFTEILILNLVLNKNPTHIDSDLSHMVVPVL